MQTESSGELSLTKTGEIFGSPLYMSPEQALGKKVDQRSDIYSAGCVLFHALTGAPPHHGETAIETLMQHLNQAPLSLTEASIGHQFPKELEQIAAKALAKKPDDRYQSFEELQADLKSFSRGVSIGPAKEKKPDTKKVSKKQIAVWAGSLAATFVVIAGMVWTLFAEDIKSATKPARSKPSLQIDEQATQHLGKPVKRSPSKSDGDLKQNAPPEIKRDQLDKQIVGYALENHVFNGSGRQTTDDSIRQLVSIANEKNEPVFTANLDSCRVTDGGIEILSSQPLKILSLNSATVTGECAKSIAKMHSTLIDLGLHGLKGATRQNLSPLGSLNHLESLDLGYGANLTSAHLAFLPSLKKLKSLNLESNEFVTDDVFKYVVQLPNLRDLNISYSGFTDKGMTSVAKIKSLRTLRARGSYLHDSGAAQLVKLQQLVDLDLSDTKITSKSLATFIAMPKLRHLILQNCLGMSKEGINQLSKALPSCNIQVH